jgi:hypothetical protein
MGRRDVHRMVESTHQCLEVHSGQEHDLCVLTRLQLLLLNSMCSDGKIQMRQVTVSRGLGWDAVQMAPFVRAIAGLFKKLAAGRVRGGLVGVDSAGGNLERLPAQAVALLTNQHDVAVSGHRYDARPIPGMNERVLLEHEAPAGADAIDLQREPRTPPNRLALEHLPLLHSRY